MATAILPIDSKFPTPSMEISASEKRTKAKTKDQKDKRQRQYIQRTITFKASQTKSFNALVNQLPQHGFRKQADKCMAILKIDSNGKPTFNFCNQKQDFKLIVDLKECRSDIYKQQQENQLKLMDGRRRNQNFLSQFTNQQGEDQKQNDQKQKQKEKKKKTSKVINSDQQDDPYSGDSD